MSRRDLKNWLFLSCILGSLTFVTMTSAQDRFPKPDFESGYQLPLTTTPAPRHPFWELTDIVILISMMGIASYFIYKKRSRKAVAGLSIFSLLYFGFIKEGCVCSIGALQNIALALSDVNYVVPLSVIAMFVVPLIFTLFWGRTYCAAVCPLGALQDIVSFRPRAIPDWLSHALGILPYIYLSLALLFAATGSAFIICRYDPFVAFFRLNASFGMLIFSIFFLLLSVFIARPYCRFLCPYGVLLGWMSLLSRKQISITPDNCIQCRLCEDACPVGAIRQPSPEKIPESQEQGIRRLAMLLALLPLVMLIGGWSLAKSDRVLSQVHPTVRLAKRVQLENAGILKETSVESRTFRASGTSLIALLQTAQTIRAMYRTGGWLVGSFLGLILILKIIQLSVHRTRRDYLPDRTICLNCARCYDFCPKERVRWKTTKQYRKKLIEA